MVCGFSKEVFVMRKRLLAALLSAVLLLTLVPAAFAASDLDGHWAKKYIDYLADEDIINPSATTGKYQPDTKVTRAEFMRYINRAFHGFQPMGNHDDCLVMGQLGNGLHQLHRRAEERVVL